MGGEVFYDRLPSHGKGWTGPPVKTSQKQKNNTAAWRTHYLKFRQRKKRWRRRMRRNGQRSRRESEKVAVLGVEGGDFPDTAEHHIQRPRKTKNETGHCV